jgi:S1-C subfamily serine protease
MITSNVIHRTFLLSTGKSTGTCFAIDVEHRQYVVTAKHVIEGVTEFSSVKIFFNGLWHDFGCNLVGVCSQGTDVAVLRFETQLSPNLPLQPTWTDLMYGQDVFFLGFPYGWSADIGKLNRNFPMPFVKKAIVSNMPQKENGKSFIFLDGHNNPGFSGGPVVFKPQNNKEFRVAAVISGYRYTEEPIYQSGSPLPLAYKYNTGIILAYGIEHAIKIIESNPLMEA